MSFSPVSSRRFGFPSVASPLAPARPATASPVAEQGRGPRAQPLDLSRDSFTPAGAAPGLEQLQALIGRSLREITQELRTLVDKAAQSPDASSFTPVSSQRAPVSLDPAAQQVEAPAEASDGMGPGTLSEKESVDTLHDEGVGHKPFGEVPYINQYHPAGEENGYSNGKANCGPTSMAMIARSLGYGSEMTDAELITHLNEVDGKMTGGTDVEAIGKMAEKMGLESEQRGPRADVDWIADQLKQGKLVVANGDVHSLGPNKDPNVKPSGHYVVVTGMDEQGNFLVKDPAQPEVNTVPPEELETFINKNPNGGYQFAIG
ncbi:C39 family peptidase [Pyxidicoccus xibeiensis]|uniref:C39 family peptidase n=1 Tax=Pyxidicoccus xibeiensis TaxID=2906759 RepID=UPI0020A7D495|nr:C39 family peptidase [Pyxidicoccus xibeiensis]MCP3138342.1 C39 family peptidase [Pyxidicoccus xibeiensis]